MKACDVLDGSPTLPIIESKEEQDFLVNYIFTTEKKVNNFWLGAKFSGAAFKWSDNTVLSYTNWDKDSPRNKANYCMQMQSDVAHLGKWIDEPCERDNAVVCQKVQLWTSAQLQKIVLETRKELKASQDQANKQISALKLNGEEANLKIIELKQLNQDANQKIVDATTKITNLTQNPVPVGFTFVQMSSQSSPKEPWPAVEWEDITAKYAGLFFRAEGGGAAQFGVVQEDNAPRVTEVRWAYYTLKDGGGKWDSTALNVDGWSSSVGVFSGSFNSNDGYTHQFRQSGGEVRPRNTAIRVWKSTK